MGEMHIDKQDGFRVQLETLINKHSKESGSDTPDFILADFLSECLIAFDRAVLRRAQWYEPDHIIREMEKNAYYKNKRYDNDRWL